MLHPFDCSSISGVMDSYPRCATCKHWEPPDRYTNPPWTLGARCAALTEHDNRNDGRGGLIVTSSDYDIHTKAEFGCVLHEPKES